MGNAACIAICDRYDDLTYNEVADRPAAYVILRRE